MTETTPLSPPLSERLPIIPLYKWLDALWLDHFHTSDQSYVVETRLPPLFPDIKYGGYRYQREQLALAMEHLAQTGSIQLSPDITDADHRFRPNLDFATLSAFVNQSPLQGISVGVVGGPEGRVFAALGATTINFDPRINQAPPVNLPTLTEVPHSLYPGLARNYQNRFDLTYSRWLLDYGSGLDHAQDCLPAILYMTKPGGLSVHNGNLLPELVKHHSVSSLATIREIAACHHVDTFGDSTVIYVLQKR